MNFVSTTGGVAGGSIAINGDVGCAGSCNQVSTGAGIELGCGGCEYTSSGSVDEQRVGALPALTVLLYERANSIDRVRTSEGVEVDVDDLGIGIGTTKDDGVTSTSIHRGGLDGESTEAERIVTSQSASLVRTKDGGVQHGGNSAKQELVGTTVTSDVGSGCFRLIRSGRPCQHPDRRKRCCYRSGQPA